MKLRYQSVTRVIAWGECTKVTPRILNRYNNPGTEIEVPGITTAGGIGGAQADAAKK